MLDHFVETEGDPEVIKFSGGEPTIHPDLMEMIQAAKDRGIRQVMINTNGVRIARDGKFLDELARQNPVIYLQFDGLRTETYVAIRGENLLELKLKALDRLAEKGMDAVLVAAIERGVNTDEVGANLKFELEHPAVRGVVFQPVTHVGRHMDFDPMERVTIPGVIHGIVDQSDGQFVLEDFVPVPCCFPTCQVNSYAFVDGDKTVPLPRMLDIDNTSTTSPTGHCLSPPIPRTCRRPWKASGQPRRWLARKRRPTSSNAPADRAWSWNMSWDT